MNSSLVFRRLFCSRGFSASCRESELVGAGALPPHAEEASLYLHWPFCLRRCSYCNFNKYVPRRVDNAAMTRCLVKETATLLRLSRVARINSVFFGGGTPSLASPSTIAAVLETVSQNAHLPNEAEVTLEVNPTPTGMAKLKDFTEAGVNRFSVGVQSLRDDDLKRLGRDHSSWEALKAISEARTLCPGRVSVDVMFGLPGQSVESWEGELERVLDVCDDHVSLYQLTLERGTQLFKQVEFGEQTVPGDDVTAVMYRTARRILENRGFLQYEVSNFAKNGAVSLHNLGYWRARQYIGVGPGAHGRFVPQAEGAVQREARTQTLEPDVWMREVQQVGHGTRRRTRLTQLALLEEVLVMALRMTDGLTHQDWAMFNPDAGLHCILGQSEDVLELQERGLLILDVRGLRCSWEGLALLDSMLPTLLFHLEKYISNQEKQKEEGSPSLCQGGKSKTR
ncbi:radical S-adenosyl methionine domain-containing protein 1, mitochondrial [Denticeps clupeoides]|uniref:Radical S-adenosyl methionine domain-containing protein n=1 Tax=Denticeps clupeoides TaxID=299321 RepID=A0AAY4BPH9_9TELE|nr:radical S-adenosyl methionine domain-containing protein 1, mitochondrial [Denticeps clupeoides]